MCAVIFPLQLVLPTWWSWQVHGVWRVPYQGLQKDTWLPVSWSVTWSTYDPNGPVPIHPLEYWLLVLLWNYVCPILPRIPFE